MMSCAQASPDQNEGMDCQFCVEEYQSLLIAQRAIGSSLDPNLVAQSIAEEARRITSSEMGIVYLLRKNRLEVFAVAGCLRKSLLGHGVSAERSLAGTAVNTARSLVIANTQSAGGLYSPVIERFQARSILVAPIVARNAGIGAVLVANRRPDSFSPVDVCLLEQIAACAAVAVDHARRYVSAQQEAAHNERRRMVRRLQEAVFQSLFSVALIADILPRLWDRDPLEGRSRMEELRRITRGALDEARSFYQDE